MLDQTYEEQPPPVALVDQTHEELPAAVALVDQTHEEQPPAAGLVDQNNTSGKFSSDAEAADEDQQENAMPQLLEEENIQLSVSGELRRVHLKYDGEKPLILDTLATLVETVRQGNKTTRTELESNSRTVRCLEKTVSAELKENNRLLNEINLNLKLNYIS